MSIYKRFSLIMFRFAFSMKCPPFKSTSIGLKAGEDGGSKIYQRFFDYIYRSSKYINDSKRNIDLPTS
ncbi:hypothetical protein EXW60_07280 [Bacillus mycoides]|nr:hypothetical protein EXW60_07280 [Bacillus mycoides]QWG92016.1 hypothetical protein EXW40_23745 [Bacillus mycoides]